MYTKLHVRDRFGFPRAFRSSVDAGLLSRIPTDGLVFYAPLATPVTSAETGQALTEHDSPSYSIRDGIPCLYTNEGYLSSEVLNLRGASSQTLSIWLKVAYPSYVGGALAHGSGSDMSMAAIGANEENAFVSFFGTSADYNYNVDLTDRMHHLAMTYDGSNASAYVDGVFIRQDTPGAINVTSDAVRIGASFDYRFLGFLAAARIYNRVLSPTEISLLSSEFSIE